MTEPGSDNGGRRIAKIESSTWTRFLYAGSDVIAEVRYSGTDLSNTSTVLKTTYNYFGNFTDDLVSREHIVSGASQGLQWFHADMVQSVTAVTNSAGQVLERYAYSPFGKTTIYDANWTILSSSAATVDNPYQFLGRRYDAGTGLHYFRARYYDAEEGRFLQRDPLNDKLNVGNLYVYASNNPLNYMDPWGTSGQSPGIIGAIGKGIRVANAFTNGVQKGVINSFWDLFSSPIPDISGMTETAKRIFKNPGKFLRDLKKAIMGLTAEQIAEVVGEMVGGALFDGAASAIMTFLTGGAGGAVVLQKAIKALRKSIKLIDRVMDMAKRAKRFIKKAKCKLLGTGCFVAGTQVQMADGTQKPIETITIGLRVAVDRTKSESNDPEPTIDETWIVITVVLPSMTGNEEDQGEVKLLRSNAWLKANSNKEQTQIRLEFGELGINGWYPIQSIEEAPEIEQGEGGLVVSTVNRVVTDICELKLQGCSESIVGTGNHRFWSVDRNTWVAMDSLKIGERLLQQNGKATIVKSVQKFPGRRRVFNFEVTKDHNYFVDVTTVLVHNEQDCVTRKFRKTPRTRGDIPNPNAAKNGVEHHWGGDHLDDSPFESWTDDPDLLGDFNRPGGKEVTIDLNEVPNEWIEADFRTPEGRQAAANRARQMGTDEHKVQLVERGTSDREVILWREGHGPRPPGTSFRRNN